MKQWSIPDNKALIWALIFIITLLWGYAWVLMKEALTYMGPFTFSAFRFGTGAATLLLIVWILKIGLPPKRYWKHLIIVGILQTSIVFLLVMYGLEFVDAGQSSILLYSMPVWSSILAVIFLGEKITPAKMTGLIMGILGLLTILGWDIWTGQSFDVIFGQLLIIKAALSWAAANIYYRLRVQELPKLQASAFQMFFGAIGITAATIIMEWGEPIVLNAESIYYILFTGVLASALCFTVWYIVISKIDMVSATISTLLVPIFGLTFSSILLDEQMTVGVVAGSALIIIGISIATISKKEGKDG
ncbi:DMT family transporter [Natribacillus halophilus]|uniref:Permease of the drug/metabolite transporter (DMT) superfamily n=1 Tax=Natribacillus halophilus TaxID=549003 RepID=A0A1G8KCS5_9BACI|nr:DMT family transporter [Natribacillus halophilus]SDI41222.1 Permease of the drug/metabolite transporter (DMT) superfamily [Natribacillus halophilus]